MQGDHFLIRKSLPSSDKERIISNIVQLMRMGMETGSIFVQIDQNEKAYTPSQHAAIWKYCGMVAVALNEKGITLIKLLESMKKGMEMEVTKEAVKYQMWGPVQKAMFKTESMTSLERAQVSNIYDVMNRFLVNTHEIFVPFPSKDILYEGQ